MNIPKDWNLNGRGDAIWREFNFKNFVQGVAFVNQVANLAEAAKHHPNISISYTKVSLSISTHSAGKVTEKDLDLALKINGLPL
jgi:4a-hydroxytetrahydrobiopterin dehydratase